MNANWNTLGPLIFMAIMGLALLVYVVLDGYDLGVGILLPLADDAEKDLMVASIGPFWDANETWLVLGVGVLLVAFPVAHGVVLGALYLPVALMLTGLTLRGVAFDFRVKAGAAFKPLWNRAFAAGSLLAALAQGWMLGSYITGFDTSPLGLLFSAVVALTLPAAYVMLGAGWLIIKTSGDLRARAARWSRQAWLPMALALVAVSVATPLVSERVANKWFGMPQLFALMPIPLVCAAALWGIRQVASRRALLDSHGWLIFAGTVMIFVLAFFGLAYSLFPYIVVDRMNIWEAAASADSLAVLMVGVALTLPAIIGYTIFMYRVFHGPATTLSYGAR